MQSPHQMKVWLEENHDDLFACRYRVKDVLYSQKSPYQMIEIVETFGHGRMLVNDGYIMLSERDEFIYHEMLAHVPLFVHPDPRRILVIGGGDGGTVREVLRHQSVEKIVLVEIDACVIEACKRYLPQTSACLDDPKVTIYVQDGAEFVQQTRERFDIVLIDATDPWGPSESIYSNEFYQKLTKLLTKDGIVVAQGESFYYELEAQISLLKILAQNFSKIHLYNYANLIYPGGAWSFAFASNRFCPLTDFAPQRVTEAIPWQLRYYHPGMHRAAFQLPNFAQALVGAYLSSSCHQSC